MTISEGLFAFLLFLAVIPAYVFAVYGLYIARMTSSMVGKLLEQDMNNALGAATAGVGGSPVYSTSLSMQDFAKLLQKDKPAKKGNEGGSAPNQSTGSGHYL